jgi:hypothetical protein
MTELKKQRPGRWKAGQSGNPAGRKPGSGEVAQLRAAIGKRVPELLQAMMDKALEGDVGAARLLLERSIAPLKAAEQTQALSLPDGTLTQQGRAVLASVATGELAPGQGSQLITAIGTLARVSEIDELQARITALENQLGKS